MCTNEFKGFNHEALVMKRIEFINEMSKGMTTTFVAKLSGLSDRTVRKVLAGITTLESGTYIRVIEGLAIHHHYSQRYVEQRMLECEHRRIIWN